MDAWDYLMMGTILLFIGSILVSGALAWAWRRFHPVFRQIHRDWRAFRAYRRVERKRAEYVLWKQDMGRIARRGQ